MEQKKRDITPSVAPSEGDVENDDTGNIQILRHKSITLAGDFLMVESDDSNSDVFLKDADSAGSSEIPMAADPEQESDEAPLSIDVVPAMDQGGSPEDEALDKFERLLETKEVEGKRENERMLALERKAAELEQGTATEPADESPRDRSVKSETPKKRKGGAEARLRKAEQNFVADPARKRSPDVIPLSVQFNDFLRKLRKTVKQVKVYQEARREVEATRTKVCHIFAHHALCVCPSNCTKHPSSLIADGRRLW